MRQDPWVPLVFILTWARVARAVLVYAQKLPPPFDRCSRRFERRRLGEIACRCRDAVG